MSPRYFGFLELPLEIREAIYSLVLLPESGVLKRRFYDKTYPLLRVSPVFLMLACRQI